MSSRPWDAGKPVSARGRYYVACAASVTTQLTEAPAGEPATGAAGDELDWLWLYPTTTTPGQVVLLDGITPVWTWPAGLTIDGRPIFVPLNIRSRTGPWSLTTPATFTALAAGAFA